MLIDYTSSVSPTCILEDRLNRTSCPWKDPVLYLPTSENCVDGDREYVSNHFLGHQHTNPIGQHCSTSYLDSKVSRRSGSDMDCWIRVRLLSSLYHREKKPKKQSCLPHSGEISERQGRWTVDLISVSIAEGLERWQAIRITQTIPSMNMPPLSLDPSLGPKEEVGLVVLECSYKCTIQWRDLCVELCTFVCEEQRYR